MSLGEEGETKEENRSCIWRQTIWTRNKTEQDCHPKQRIQILHTRKPFCFRVQKCVLLWE